ncbi:hypothetical protein ACRW7A_22350, partial [Escherichia coli]
RPLTDFGGKTSIFSHPVYLFLREFSLQDFRGGSAIIRRRFNSKPSGVSNSCSFYGNTYELAGIKCKKM